MLNENLNTGMKRLVNTVARIEDDLMSIHEDIAEVFDTLASLDETFEESGPSLDVEPHVLLSGPFKGKTALQWFSGNFAHNDVTIPRSSIKEAYDYFDIPRHKRIPYQF
jgi:hypothetical protein